jgi:uncharacterized damage-inducible protein DinB
MLDDPRRTEPGYRLGEREMLESWLEFHRVTLLLKCEGVDEARLKERPVASSLLSLHGLVRHMAEVERGWFQRTLIRDPGAPPIWASQAEPEAELWPLDGADWSADLAVWQAQCDTSRASAATKGLDDTGSKRDGKPVSLRWIYAHMIEEYARHNGHADLIREMLDGSVGD